MWAKNKHFGLALFVFLLIIVLLGCQKESTEEAEDYLENLNLVQDEILAEEPELIQKVHPVTVIIDNHTNARPQSGLQEATIVYEFLVEGGITRFLAVFDTFSEEKFIIGPVRSLRPYFAHQALEHEGVVAHGGYSQITREAIKNLQLKHISKSSYFYRDSSRKAPHNLYTDIEKIYEAVGEEDDLVEIAISMPNLPFDYEVGDQLEISYSRTNKVSYSYSEDHQAYLRYINQNPHVDRESGLQYTTRRVILRRTNHTNISNSQLLNIDLSGEGEGLLFEEGRQYEIYWVHDENRTIYYHIDGTPVDISYGNTWIQVVP